MELNGFVEFFQLYGYMAVFGVLLLCGFGLPMPEDISLIAGGIISGLGYTNVHVMVVVAFAGVIIGDAVIYSLGRFFGEVIFHKWIVGRFITHERYASAQNLLQRYGKRVIFVARFMPGLRAPIFLTAGITRFVSPPGFFLIDGMAALISVPAWVYLGYLGANNIDWVMRIVTRSQYGLYGIAVCILVFFIVTGIVRYKMSLCGGSARD